KRQIAHLLNIGVLYTDQGNYAKALDSLFEARTLLRDRMPDLRSEGNCSINIGRVYEGMRDYQQADQFYSEALEVALGIGDKVMQTIARVNLGLMQRQLGQLERALESFQTALGDAQQINFRPAEIAALGGVGSVQLGFANFEAAVRANTEALRLAREIGDREREIEALIGLARGRLGAGQAVEAQHLLEDALSLAREASLQPVVVEIHELQAEIFESLGETTLALSTYREFHRLERALLSDEAERRTKNLRLHFDLERARNETEAYRLRNETIREVNAQLESKVRERTAELEQFASDLEETRLEVVMRLAVAAEYRDDNTGKHTQRVGLLSALIAQQLGMPPEEVDLLRLAARLHDVGKIGISDLILLKEGKLTSEEFQRIKDHTTIGAQILSGGKTPLLQMAEVVARTHHERWEGGGYPLGLSGEDIALVGRIVTVADVYDALMAHRPYKQPWTEEAARAEIIKQSGRQFDPRVVEAFLVVVDGYVGSDDFNSIAVNG
ncbi:MAG: tetratricopeptide repeat protein, partial [Pleurocapsa sp. SU_196_0]|nr:tetratricopeptide repeat protein [Pleurocapsa sp. SU_196_0]